MKVWKGAKVEPVELDKKKIAAVTIELFDDGSTNVTIPEEFQEKIKINQLEEILRQTLDKVYINRISASVVQLLQPNKNEPKKNN